MIKKFIRMFFKTIEETTVLPPSTDELIDGQAFKIKHYPLTKPVQLCARDKLIVTVHDRESKEDFIVEEEIESSIYVDTVSTIRFNDALGYKHAIGAIFGQKNKEKV